ncbi:ArpU family phage packaging/lysis transcriptional regulator [Bacillus gobiensis]|uniref:ArpU family transcriptional regulator n=1 Tax=Bacillus gobiensis TaxID=1441095 RepID=A0A0M4FRM6_9BACI|nr:ArpU family phage packaging/lysis transcriptional regulator [Bacillus gobiensis]ALC80430.1 ArpU family transcriptional regulator [Bacillus gobiensis]
MSQLAFVLPEINRDATRQKVESLLERYRILLLQVDLDFLPKITSSYTMVAPSITNEFHSSTEDAATKNVDHQRQRDKFLKRMQQAVNRLSLNERSIIIKRYMDQEEYFDYEIYYELGMSERKYYRIKSRAFYKLAFALKEEVYIEHEGVN